MDNSSQNEFERKDEKYSQQNLGNNESQQHSLQKEQTNKQQLYMADKHADLIQNRIKLLQKRSQESNEKIQELQQKTEKYCELKRLQIEKKMEQQLEKQKRQEELRQKQIENYMKYKQHKAEMDFKREKISKLKQKETSLVKEEIKNKLDAIRGDAGTLIMENRSKSLSLKEQTLIGRKNIQKFWNDRLTLYSELANQRRKQFSKNFQKKQKLISTLQSKEEDLISQFTMLQDRQRLVEEEYEQVQCLDDETFMKDYLEKSTITKSANERRKNTYSNQIGKFCVPFKISSKPKYQQPVLKQSSMRKEQSLQPGDDIFLTMQNQENEKNKLVNPNFKSKYQIYGKANEQTVLPNLLNLKDSEKKQNESELLKKEIEGMESYAKYQSKISEFE